VRDGDPAALAALCSVRGPSVLAYCRQVAGESHAAGAAADAFARFRAAVVAGSADPSLNPEALLVSATRSAAASIAGNDARGACAEVPQLLAARADRTISIADLERLDQHLAGCWACRAPVARFHAAERAYRDPPEQTVAPAIAEQIVDALATAVPAPALAPVAQEADPPVEPVPTAPPAPLAAPAAMPAAQEAEPPAAAVPIDPHATQAFTVDQPTVEFRAPDMLPDDEPLVAAPEAPEERATSRRRAGIAALTRRPGGRRGRATGDLAVLTIPTRRPPAPHLPSTRGRRSRLPSRRRGRRPGRTGGSARLPVVLPIVLLAGALLIALFASGLLGGADPASSSNVALPTDRPTQGGTPPKVVAVPDAKDASGSAVELAKARARAQENGTSQSDSAPATPKKTAATPPSTSAGAPTAAATTPPPAQPAAAPPPAAATKTADSGSATKSTAKSKSTNATQIDADSSATGAEQVPASGDTANVPDLAPPQAGTHP
jgi:hypothetical protein